MITAFALLLDRCGLSVREAADFLQARPDTVKSWSSGRNPTPDGVIAELRLLYARVERAAAEALAVIAERATGDTEIEIGVAADDDDASSVGWPCRGAHAAMIGIVVARCLRPVRVVRRGSTPATAAAARAMKGT